METIGATTQTWEKPMLRHFYEDSRGYITKKVFKERGLSSKWEEGTSIYVPEVDPL